MAWPLIVMSSCSIGSFSPAAMRTCCSTRSMPGDHLGDRVFDLKAGVHLHEEELVRPIRGDDEFDGACAGVVHAASGIAGGRADARPGRRIEQGRRRFLDDLLVTPLQAAFALAEVDHVAVPVGEHLHLDVPGVQHKPLDKQRVVAERRRRLPTRARQRGGQLRGLMHHPHPLASTACRRLDQHRITDLVRSGDQIGVSETGARHTRHDRHAERRHRGLRGDLVAHGLDRRGRRTDERDASLLQRRGELRVLRKESVAGVDRLCAGASGRLNDCLDVEVALPRGRGADAHRDVGLGHVAGTGVGVAEHRDRADTHRPQRADDTHGDLAAVGHQNGIESHCVTSGIRRRRPTRAAPVRRSTAPAPARFWCRRDR